MERFYKIFKNKFNVIGMIHLEALPGTPKYSGNFNHIIEKALYEANLYTKNNIDAILIENMHDIPYVKNENISIEVVTSMTRIANEIKGVIPNKTPCGVQVLASGNKQALAIAKACDLQFIRAEGFVFAHVADEGWTEACAGELLRYRRVIDANNVLIFTDIKKKHSSHSVTSDTSLLETAKAAEFFLTDGIVLTGTSTGDSINLSELDEVQKVSVPILIGSGVTKTNLFNYINKCNGAIIGSHFKKDGDWKNDLDDNSIRELMNNVRELC